MRFSVGYNYDINMLKLLKAHRNNVEALYFPIPRQYTASGRALQEPKAYKNQIISIIKKCNELHIGSQLLINSTCEGGKALDKDFIESILRYISKLKKIGLSSVIVTNPVYIKTIKKAVPDIRIESSVNCYVRTLEHALYLKELGVDVITIDRDINRDILLIKKIKKQTGLKIRIMLNEGCLSNCPYRVVHYNFLSHLDNTKNKKENRVTCDVLCIQLYQKNPVKILRVPFIPPDALTYYKDAADYYKLSTRVFSTGRIESCLNAYIRKTFKGNLTEILDSPGLKYFEYIYYGYMRQENYFQKMQECDLNCKQCGYCEMLFRKAVLPRRSNFKKRSKQEELTAIALHKKSLSRPSNNSKRSYHYFRIGQAYYYLGKYREAINSILLSIKLDRSSSAAYLVLGKCYERTKQYKQALEMLIRAEKLDPEKTDIQLALARCYKKAKNEKALEKTTEKIMSIARNSMAEARE